MTRPFVCQKLPIRLSGCHHELELWPFICGKLTLDQRFLLYERRLRQRWRRTMLPLHATGMVTNSFTFLPLCDTGRLGPPCRCGIRVPDMAP